MTSKFMIFKRNFPLLFWLSWVSLFSFCTTHFTDPHQWVPSHRL